MVYVTCFNWLWVYDDLDRPFSRASKRFVLRWELNQIGSRVSAALDRVKWTNSNSSPRRHITSLVVPANTINVMSFSQFDSAVLVPEIGRGPGQKRIFIVGINFCVRTTLSWERTLVFVGTDCFRDDILFKKFISCRIFFMGTTGIFLGN